MCAVHAHPLLDETVYIQDKLAWKVFVKANGIRISEHTYTRQRCYCSYGTSHNFRNVLGTSACENDSISIVSASIVVLAESDDRISTDTKMVHISKSPRMKSAPGREVPSLASLVKTRAERSVPLPGLQDQFSIVMNSCEKGGCRN